MKKSSYSIFNFSQFFILEDVSPILSYILSPDMNVWDCNQLSWPRSPPWQQLNGRSIYIKSVSVISDWSDWPPQSGAWHSESYLWLLIAAYTLPDRFLMVFCCLWYVSLPCREAPPATCRQSPLWFSAAGGEAACVQEGPGWSPGKNITAM